MMTSLQKIKLLLSIACFVATGTMAQVVRNTNATGPNSLEAAVAQAEAAGGAQTITFDIPGPGPHIIQPGTIQLNSATPSSITIDATSQRDYAGEPIIILRGNGSGTCFDIQRSNITIKGFIIQNYAIGYNQTSGTDNVVQNCWFGLNAAGALPASANENIKTYGFIIDGGSVTIGSATDVSAATRNVISNAGTAGILFKTAGSGSVVGNNYIGTDKTGTLAAPNGFDENAGTEFRHGIEGQGTQNITIKNNVISANKSGGINLYEGSHNALITGNKIGTDVTGMLPLGNRNFGIRIKNSNGNTIGGPAIADRNIISANGSSDYTHRPRTTFPREFDWYNSCGIYLFISGNNTIANNYIGVNGEGNKISVNTPFDMGNFYAGLKIDGDQASNNNRIGLPGAGNVIGGNGFRSYVAQVAFSLRDSLGGHGMIIKDRTTTNTVIVANKIGIGADGISPAGNRQDGISVQGAGATTRIGGSTPAERNIISNNTWGIYVASNYYNSQTLDCRITGNYIGTDSSGKVAVGNGTRAGISSGGGIGVVHFSQGVIIGGAAAGEGNVVSGNRVGIALMGGSPSSPGSPIDADAGKAVTSAKVYGNLVGLASGGNIKLPNTENGLYISQKAHLNDIGGDLPGQGNRIAWNGLHGIYSEDALENRITGNSVFSNSLNGIHLIESPANVLKGNSIQSNSKDGIVLLSSNGNRLTGNTIGDLATASKGNKGHGISITESSGTIIGGVAAGEGNIIGNNTGNGVLMLSTTSNNNSIHQNQFSCNGLRGIELSNEANNNYGKPVFKGTETAMLIEGPANSFIELYSLDECNTCAATPGNKLQGRRLIGSGPSPFPFPGTPGVTYTATASELGTTSAHKTSEFSDCYTYCPPVKGDLTVTGSTVCPGTNGVIKISATSNISYQAFKNNVAVGPAKNGPGDITLEVFSKDLVTGNNVITVKAQATGCSPYNLDNTATIIQNPAVTVDLAVTGSRVCKGTNGVVSIKASQSISYQAFLNGKAVGAPGNGPGDISLSIPKDSLREGNNLISFTGTPAGLGCLPKDLTNKATVIQNPSVRTDLEVTGSTVCLGSPGTVGIKASQAISYQAYRNNIPVGPATPGPNDIVWTIPAADLVAGSNVITFKGTPTGLGCLEQELLNKATVIVNTRPKKDSDVKTTSPICSGGNATLTVEASEKGKSYQVFDETGAPVSAVKISNADGPLSISLTLTAIKTYTLSVNVTVPGCTGTATLDKKVPFVVNKGLTGNLRVENSGPVCMGGPLSVSVRNSELNVFYQAFHRVTNEALTAEAPGTNGILILPVTKELSADTHVVYFKARIAGCGTFIAGDTTSIIVSSDVNKGLEVSATTPICFKDVAVVSIKNSEDDKTYQVLEKGIPVSEKKRGNNGLLAIDVPNLSEGDHKFTISVTVPGCKNDTLTRNPVTRVNTVPDSTLKVGTNGPVCNGNNALFYVLKSQLNKKYQIFHNNTSVSQIMAGNGDTLKIPLLNLDSGTYVLTARATSDGCRKSVDLQDKGTIVVNKNPVKNLNAIVNGPVCANNPAIVTVENAERGKTYRVFYKGKPVSTPATATQLSANLQITVNTATMNPGQNTLSIAVSVPGCTPDTLIKKPVLTISPQPDSSLLVSAVASPICKGSTGSVVIKGIQPLVKYQAFIGNDTASQNLSGPGPDITLAIPSDKLKEGYNHIYIKASITGCKSSTLSDTAGIKVNRGPGLTHNVSVEPDTICLGGETTLTIATSDSGVTYQAVVGSKIVSSAVLSNGGEVRLKLSGLAIGSNLVKVKAMVSGCGSLDLEKSTAVVVNKGPKLNYRVKGSEVCKGQAGTVTIDSSETGATYQAFLKATDVPVSQVMEGTGSAITIPLQPSSNPVDTIVIKASVTGCGLVRLDSLAIVKTNDKDVFRLLSTEGSDICTYDTEATAKIINALKDVSYTASVNGKTYGPLAGQGTNLVFTFPAADLGKGSNRVNFVAIVQGCGPVPLDSSAMVNKNDLSTSKELPVRGSDICIGDLSGTATILGAVKGVSYQAMLRDTLLPEVLTGNDQDLVFTIPGNKIKEGRNVVSFTAAVPGCSTITMSNSAIINRNDNTTSRKLSVRGSTVCGNEPVATAKILNAVSGISYQAFKDDEPVSGTLTADGSDLTLFLDVKKLSSGSNTITFWATVAGCVRQKLDSTAIVIVLGERYQISGSTLRCFNTEGNYSIDPIPGIQKYAWTVPEGAIITSGDSTNSINVSFGTLSGIVSVTPVGSIGACNGITSELSVSVEKPFTDSISIVGKDTLCVNSTDRIFVDSTNVYGVDRIVWTWTNGIDITDTLSKKSVFNLFDVEYPVSGLQMITATPHLRCSDTFGKPDTLLVKVLTYPRVEAGENQTVFNDFNSPVFLNGSGSSLNGKAPDDSLTYRWYSYRSKVNIFHADRLEGAYFVPTDAESVIYLRISNHNRCTVYDSTVITVLTSIEIPNVFTPNADGTHDKWEIKNLNRLYPNNTVEVFNKWGSLIFKSNGYSEPWDGTRNGEELPVATYYYVVDFKDGTKPKPGSVTILR